MTQSRRTLYILAKLTLAAGLAALLFHYYAEAVRFTLYNLPWEMLIVCLLGAGGLWALQRSQADDRARFPWYAVLLLLCLLMHGCFHLLDRDLSWNYIGPDYVLMRILLGAFGVGYSLSAWRTAGPALRPLGRLGLALFTPLLLLELIYNADAAGWVHLGDVGFQRLYQVLSLLLLLAWGWGCYRVHRRLRNADPNAPEAQP